MSDVKNSALATGLVSAWEFEEAIGTRVDSHSGNDLTDAGAVGSVAGLQGNAAYFVRGSSDYMTLSLGGTGLELSTSFTVAFPLKYISTSTPAQAIYQAGNATNFYVIQSVNGKIYFTKDNIADYISTGGLTSGVQGTVVITKDGDGAGNLKMYINGTLDSTHSVGSVISPSGTALVGAYNSGAGNVRWLNAALDNTYIWNRALSSTEVTTLHNGGAWLPYDAGGGAGYRHVPQIRPFAGL